MVLAKGACKILGMDSCKLFLHHAFTLHSPALRLPTSLPLTLTLHILTLYPFHTGVLENLFKEVDRNNDQIISMEEMKSALYSKVESLQPENMSNIFRVVDLNASGFVNKREWKEFFHLVKSQPSSYDLY